MAVASEQAEKEADALWEQLALALVATPPPSPPVQQPPQPVLPVVPTTPARLQAQPVQTPEQRLKEIKKAAAKKRDAADFEKIKEQTRGEREKARLLKERLSLKAQKEAEFKRDNAPLIAEHQRGREIEKARLLQERLLLKAEKEAAFKRDHAQLIAEHERKKREAQQQQAPPPLEPRILESPAQQFSPLTEPDSSPAARPFTPPRRTETEPPQALLCPPFPPARPFEYLEGAISPTRPPIDEPALQTPPRRRRIAPVVLRPLSPVPSTAEQRARAAAWNMETFGQPPAQRVSTTAEQRARAARWNAETHGHRPVQPRQKHSEAELERMLQGTPSPQEQAKEPDQERKMTAEEQEEELELERTQTPTCRPARRPSAP